VSTNFLGDVGLVIMRTVSKRQTLAHVLIYGLGAGVMIAVLKLIEFRFLVVEHSIEIYGGLIALLFAGVGIWLGLKLTRKKEIVVVKEVPVPVVTPQAFALNEARLRDLGITRRELEILELIAQGMSNREIAEKLFVSENTVKTHSSRLFDKLSAKRRTQAVQIAKEMGLIP
jgi:DNA-binding CsgD family transcriptional regulator